MTASFVHFVLGIGVMLAVTACKTKPSQKDERVASGAKASSDVTPKASEVPRARAILDFVAPSAPCTFGHRGVLLDLGERSLHVRPGGSSWEPPDMELREREGASWASVREKSLVLPFVSVAEKVQDASIVVEARVRGAAAKHATVYLNGKALGTLAFTKGETSMVSARGQGVLNKGANELLVRFTGISKHAHDVLAELDWLRVGPSDGDAPYAAPTRADAVTTVTLAGAPKRAVSLRAPGFARCTTLIPNGSRLEGFVGVTSGEADADVRVLVDRMEPRVVGSVHVGGPGESPAWKPLSLPLGDVGAIASVELVARTSTKGARVAFGEVRVTHPSLATPTTAATPSARGVVLVVLGSTPRAISLYGGSITTPKLDAFAESALVFESHRASSSYAPGSFGSMLSGLSPRSHGATDAETAMSPSVASIAEAARQAGVATALFTANPTTTTPYGLTRGFETVETLLPGAEGLATTLFERAGDWLTKHTSERFFLVIHARGGHPPWDITPEELMELPPRDYHGALEPKRAGEALGRARKAGGRGFSEADRERAVAMHARAVSDHDAALGAFMTRVRALGHDADTSWIITSDIGVEPASRVPFLEDDTLEERGLAIPLVLRLAGGTPKGRVKLDTSSEDVARTILDSLGLPPLAQLRGQSLAGLASDASLALRVRPHLAQTATRWSLRWAGYALSSTRERAAKLCALSIDAECMSDAHASDPLAAEALEALAWGELVTMQPLATGRGERPAAIPTPSPVRATLDAPTSAALRAWGL